MIKHLQFKSLSTRIWALLLILCLGMIIPLSAMYSFIISSTEKNHIEELLEGAASMMLIRPSNGITIEEAMKTRLWDRVQHLVLVEDDEGNYLVRSIGGKPFSNNGEVLEIGEYVMELVIKGETEGLHTYTLSKQAKAGTNGQTLLDEEILFIVDTFTLWDGAEYLITYSKRAKEPLISNQVAMMGAILVVISFIASKIISKIICKPLKELEDHSFRVANKEEVEPLVVRTQDEIGSLVNSVNYMHRELRKKDKEQQVFLQSISHDLKTPIMVISGHAQAIRDGIYIESLDHTAEVIVNESKRLEAKVSQMLYFNTLDYMLEHTGKSDTICLKELVQNLIDKFIVLNPEIVWDFEGEDLSIVGNREHLEVAFENILDNQMRYVKDAIKIRLFREHKKIKLTIINDGPKVPEDKIAHVFDYHYRGNEGKFGLGLAITKKIICFYNGSIGIANQEDGVCFTIIF